MCPNMINFDAVDFSERHPEEVISFFWCSVYFFVKQQNVLQSWMKTSCVTSMT